MGSVVVETCVRADIEVCFDHARSVDVHVASSVHTNERAIPPGRLEGLLELGDLVTFEGRHFGRRLEHTARIVEMEAPTRFVDEMVSGAFRSFRHTHELTGDLGATTIRDTLSWVAPLGLIGRLADWLFLERYLRSFLRRKQLALEQLAESATMKRSPPS